MPQLAAITVNDGATTPVGHVFSPVSASNGKSEIADRSPAIPAGYLRISHEVRAPAVPGGAYRVVIGGNFPVVGTDTNGVVSVIRNSSFQLTINLSQSSTLQDRKDIIAYLVNYLGNASVQNTVKDIEPFY